MARMTAADDRVLIMAPIGQDAPAMAALLEGEGLATLVCAGPADCAGHITAGAGALLLTEEALELSQMPELLAVFKAQPPWSEMPVIILTRGGESRLHKLLDLLADAARTTTLLERPIGAATLVRSVQVALSSRRRQYQLRDLLSEQERSHEQLRQSEERVRSVVESITAGFHVIDAEGRFTQFNEAARQMFAAQGVDVDTLLGLHVFAEALPEASESDAAPALRRAMREHVPTAGESFYQPWNRWLDIRNYPTPEGGVATFFQDITERKMGEEALRKSEDQMRLITDATPAYISYVDKDLRFRFVNHQYEVGFGRSREELIGRRLGEVLGGPATEQLRPYMESALAGEKVHFELEAHYRALGKRFVEGFYIPDIDAKECVRGFYVLMVDITERKRVEQALAERALLAALRGDVNMALAGSETLPVVLQHCAESAVKHLDAAFARIWTLNETDAVLEMQASAGAHTERDGMYARVRMGEFNVGRIAQSARPLLFNDVQHDQGFVSPEWARKEGIVAFAGYPLVLHGRVLGVLALFARHKWSEAVLDELETIAAGMAQWVQRKRAEAELRISEERYRTLLESSPDCIKLMDTEGNLQLMNAKGMSLMEIDDFTPYLHKPWLNLCGLEQATTIRRAITWAAGGKSAHFQAFCPTAKGTPKWWDVVVAPVESSAEGGKPKRLISVSRDITASKLSEQALRESESRFRAIVSHAITGVVQVDARGRMVFVNQRWCEMTGYTNEELLGMTLAEITDPAFLSATVDAVKRLMGGAGSFRLEKCYQRKDGSVFWADSNVNAMRGADGAYQGLVAVVLDITERRNAEASLRLAKEQAETASRAKDNFLAALSHELRTPLNPVLMTASALCEDESLPGHVREQLAMIERNVSLEARLIDDLLDLTRIVRGKLTLHAEQCDMNSLIGLVVEIVREEAFEKQILIELDLSAQRSSLIGDPARLQQVFWNLLRNAVKFTPAGGKVRIRSRNVGKGREEHVSIDVKDDGIGLDTAAMERIFEPFEQASTSQEHRFGGLGLGLAIARAIVDLHHGSIHAESEGRGRGSTFTVDLPGATAAALLPAPVVQGVDGAAQEGVNAAAEPRMRLLVVEDHEPTMLVLTRLLRRAGHHVIGAGLLSDAREAAATNSFDAVISDLGLPDGTGIELMKELRGLYGLRGVMLSGYGMEEDLRRSREAGFIAHLVKPIDVKELRRALRQLSATNHGSADLRSALSS